MKKKLFITLFCFQITSQFAFSQGQQLGYLPWDKLNRLTVDYFVIDKAPDSSRTCNLHTLIKISGEAFTRKHKQLAKSYLNWCVKNYMFDDSWIDSSYGIANQVQYLQAEFDLSEVYARKLRKALYENGHATDKFVKTTQKELMEECRKEFEKLDVETSRGKNKQALQNWQNYLQTTLNSLSDYESRERINM